ncbi:MAG TPA: glycolate oxidase subunit GlcF [Sphingobium sp.]|nr:glycolate oxidase subunit GlcF [Sphingobium sp.]
MQTHFPPERLTDSDMAVSEAIIRKCVHCGFCASTCPTFDLLGDELDSPRGRIYLMKAMLEGGDVPTPDVVRHIDRCLSCLSCATTCPSGVDYGHLVDHARAYIEARYRRPLGQRLLRGVLAWTLPHPRRFRLALRLAALGRPFARLFERIAPLRPLAAMLALAPRHVPADSPIRPAAGPTRAGRVALLQGCAEPVLRPEIRAATIRLLERCGHDVVLARGEGCCGSLVHHMGREAQALDAARRNVDAWIAEMDGAGLDAILVTVSGCGSTLKDYGHMLREDPAYAEKAARVSAIALDVSEYLARIALPPAGSAPALTVAWHPPCSLQHGQKVIDTPVRLLRAAGFVVRTPANAHLCCGSAGTYNMLQPEIARQLGQRKAATIALLAPDVIATGNIGCMTQIALYGGAPTVHLVELLDWATGGPRPPALSADR